MKDGEELGDNAGPQGTGHLSCSSQRFVVQ